MTPDRVGAVIIQDGKILLVTGHDMDLYWTPGGRIEDGEDHKTTLRRELQEELGVELVQMTPFVTYKAPRTTTGEMRTVYIYFADITGEPVPAEEIKAFVWYGLAEYKAQKPPVKEHTYKRVIRHLAEHGFLH